MTKLKVLALLVVLVLGVGLVGAARADALVPPLVNGSWAGTAYANPAFDLNNDGVAARMFTLPTYGQGEFVTLEGVLDTQLIALGCSGPASIELRALGQVTFRSRGDDALFAEPDPTAPNLCFDLTNPNEVLVMRLIGGTGRYANATGTGTLTIHDIARLSRVVTLPGFPPLPAPLMVDSRGEFSLHIQ